MLYQLAEEKEDEPQFWFDMAEKEREKKGANDRQPRLVMPYGDRDDESNLDSTDEISEGGLFPPAAKRQRREPTGRSLTKKAKVPSLPEPDGDEVVDI